MAQTQLQQLEQELGQEFLETLAHCGHSFMPARPMLPKLARALQALPEKPAHSGMPAWMAALFQLEELRLPEDSDIAEIRPHIWKLVHLRKLLLPYMESHEDLPASLARLSNLRELTIDGGNIEHMPEVIAELRTLESFSFEYCHCPTQEVFDILSSLLRLKRLRYFHFHYEPVEDFLPPSFGRLQAIEELHLSKWIELKELPESIGNLRHLRVLDLANEDSALLGRMAALEELPDALCTLPRLEYLDLYGLQDLRTLPPGFSRIRSLKYLDVMRSGLAELQLTKEQWGHLEGLRMHGPLPDFSLCGNLKRLDLETSWHISPTTGQGAHFWEGPVDLSALSTLKKLESLALWASSLASTDFLADLPRLRSLFFSCDLERLPAGLIRLRNLEEISLWGASSLEFLPEDLGHMSSLKRLTLYNCGVKKLPQSVLGRDDLHINVTGRLNYRRSPH